MPKLLNNEELRRYTFVNWPETAVANKGELASQGFYATGKYLEIKCNWCGLIVGDCNGRNIDEIVQLHRRAQPSCDFLCNADGCGNMAQEKDDKNMYVEENRLATFTNWPNQNIAPEKLAKAGFYYLKRADEVKCAWCNGIIAMWEQHDDAQVEHRRFFPDCPRVQFGPLVEFKTGASLVELGIQTLRTPTRQAFASLDARLRSYVNWPIPHIQRPEELAEAGLYYENQADQVQCFHCNIGMRAWQKTDDPWCEHARLNPDCAFVLLAKGLRYVQQVCQMSEISEQAAIRNGNHLELAVVETAGYQQQNEPKSVPANEAQVNTAPMEEPFDMLLFSLDARLCTFADWPVPHIQQPLALAEAGFYYRSFNDQVRCFACQIDLQDWQREDDPWVEHVKYYPMCKFIYHIKGHNFIKEIQRRLSPQRLVRAPPVMSIDVAMRTTPALLALELGYEPTLVRTVAEARLASMDNACFTIQGFLRDVYYLANGEQCLGVTKQAAEAQSAGVATAPSSDSEATATTSAAAVTNGSAADTSVRQLEDENRRLKEARTCKVCFDREIAIVFLPCGHLVACQQCTPELMQCPLCRTDITSFVRAFLS